MELFIAAEYLSEDDIQRYLVSNCRPETKTVRPEAKELIDWALTAQPEQLEFVMPIIRPALKAATEIRPARPAKARAKQAVAA